MDINKKFSFQLFSFEIYPRRKCFCASRIFLCGENVFFTWRKVFLHGENVKCFLHEVNVFYVEKFFSHQENHGDNFFRWRKC